ncbi:hypothetical protein ACFL1G_12260, partial [Planctomycetota bacterium]
PFFVSSERGRKTILAQINNSIDGRMDFRRLSMSWFKGVDVDELSFINDSAGIWVDVKRISAKPHYGSILVGSLSFGKTIIYEPKIEINLQSLAPKRLQELSGEELLAKESKPLALPIKKIDLTVNDGGLKVTDQQGETVELSQIDSKVNLRPLGQQTNFDIDVNLAGKGKGTKLSAEGRIEPKKKTGWKLTGTSGDLTIEVNDLELASLGLLFALAGVEVQAEGEVSANIQTEIEDGQVKALEGIVKSKDLGVGLNRFKGEALTSSQLDAEVKLQRENELINIEKLLIDGDWASVTASGFVPTTLVSLTEFLMPSSAYNLKGSFKFDLAEVFSQMPRTFGLREGMEITSGQISGDIQAYQGNIQSQASLFDLAGIVDNREIALSEPVSLETKITSDDSGITFEKLLLSSSFAKIDCSGTSELIKYDANFDLAVLKSELGQFADFGEYKIAGEISSQGEVSTTTDKISAEGTSKIKNLSLSSTDGLIAAEPDAEMDFSVDFAREQGIVNINSAEINADLGQVGTQGASLLFGKEAGMSFNLPISANVDLQKLQPFLVLFASFPKQMQLAGRVETKISASSEKGTYEISTDATKIKNLKVDYPGKRPFEQEEVAVELEAELNPLQKTIDVKKLDVQSPQIKIKGDFQQFNAGGKTNLKGKAELAYNWSILSTVAGPYWPNDLTLQGQRKDVISFTSEYPFGQTDQLLANLTAKGKAGFEKGEYLGLNFGPTEFDIQVQKGLLAIAPFSTTVNDGQLKFACGADFNQKPFFLKTPEPMEIAKDIQINDKISKKLFMYLNPVFADAVNVSGVANFHCEQFSIPLAKNSENDIAVAGTISMNNLLLQASDLLGQIFSFLGAGRPEQIITINPTRFELKDGFLRYDNMQIDIGDNPVNFKGVIGLDKSLDMSVTLPYTLEGSTARTGKEIIGDRITLPLKGTVDKPELDMGKLLEEQLKQKLFEGLDKLLK